MSAQPARTRQPWLAVALAGVGIGVAGVGFQHFGTAASQLCSGAGAQLEGTWDDARRSQIQDAMLATETPFAERTWKDTSARLDSYAAAWTRMHTETCEATNVRGEQSEAAMDLRMGCLRRAKAALQATTEVLVDTDAELIANAHRPLDALPNLSACADVDTLSRGGVTLTPEEAATAEAVGDLLAKARALHAAGRFAVAADRIRDAEATIGDLAHPPIRIELALVRGELRAAEREFDAAEKSYGPALQLALQQGLPKQTQRLAVALLFTVGVRQERTEEARQRYGLLALHTPTEDARGLPDALGTLGNVMRVQGDYDEAERLQRQALASWKALADRQDSHLAAAHANLAATLGALGRHAEAEAEQRHAMQITEASLGHLHPTTGSEYDSLGLILSRQGKHKAAAEALRTGLEIRQKTLRPDHPAIGDSRTNLALPLFSLGDYEGTEAHTRAAIALLQAAHGPRHPRLAFPHSNLASALQMQEKYVEAQKEYRIALGILIDVHGSDHPMTAAVQDNLATVLHAAGDIEAAEATYRTALKQRESKLSAENPEIAMSLHNLASLLLEEGRAAEGLTLAERAHQIRNRDDLPAEHRAESELLLAKTLWEARDTEDDRRRAAKLGERARQRFEELGPPFAEQLSDAKTWTADHN